MWRSGEKRRELSDTRRGESFADGVIAIIITVLALELRPPEFQPGQLLEALLQQWPTYLAYVTSYLYIAVVWLNHKHAFVRIRTMDRGLHWANLGILSTLALLPFATAVLAHSMQRGNGADQRVAVLLYSLVGAALCGSWVVFFRYLAHHPPLLQEGVEADFYHQESLRAALGVFLYAAAGLLGAFLTSYVALVIFLALPMFYGFTSHGLYELGYVLRRRRTSHMVRG
jgi:uncharacterized membrane protein